MAALTGVGAWLRIPLPYVPVTLQLSFVLLSGAWLGARRGAASQFVYLALGLLGIPVFAGGGGPHYALAPSFGYLAAFPAAAWTVGRVSRGAATFWRWQGAVLAGTAVVYLAGVVWLYFAMRYVVGRELSPAAAALLGLAPLPKDLLLTPLTAMAGRRMQHWRRDRLRTRSGTSVACSAAPATEPGPGE